MVSLLILAAAAATVVILLLVVRLWAVIRPLHVVSRESLTPLIVAGSGGHTTEILRLVGSLSGAYSPRHYVIADSDEMSAKKIESFEHARTKRDSPPEHCLHRIPRSREVRQSWLSSVFTTLHSMWFSFPLVYHLKPDLVLSTLCFSCCLFTSDTLLPSLATLELSSCFFRQLPCPPAALPVGNQTANGRPRLLLLLFFLLLPAQPILLRAVHKWPLALLLALTVQHQGKQNGRVSPR
ncbi:asparagine-linked glycosylation 14 [Cricetulus griseus]